MILKARVQKDESIELHEYVDKQVVNGSAIRIGTILRAEPVGDEIELTIEITSELKYDIESVSFSMRGV
jgi:hypothetical protein